MASIDLSDLIKSGAQARRNPKPKPSPAVTTPSPADPPIRTDIYRLADWRTQSLHLIVTHTACTNCLTTYTNPNPHLLIRRTHPKHGTHYVEANRFHLLHENEISNLPRIIEHAFVEAEFCQSCFMGKDIGPSPNKTIIPSTTAGNLKPIPKAGWIEKRKGEQNENG